jgi:hypothetical protein
MNIYILDVVIYLVSSALIMHQNIPDVLSFLVVGGRNILDEQELEDLAERDFFGFTSIRSCEKLILD